ncbi:putative Queuosine Biosynthesis QueE Radical SAM [Vibrio nigripulchritudo SFn27]|uniref:7-carboxy-7-deazaguanine synthase n=2 Tax=Vibrio nigripulchritudo TaxID=28173 RepID=U4K5Q4_9VIBR|nr:putative Queuosine Biosynthesis QueE Radical SAM [Vibrio nigripulchritudo BLFn1]CCN88884.1 putative Queuosine Biosynthesis QueE Radical SAM [Vibrio nigripulchritudo SFn27]CCN96686.1 putative Queuosine Biosynthesis QueE Radical SAM [Vibrio nigripulchritudo ENn2]CCO39097.1 putative Queuosine Biosynthesis QueE Radical SAM [Vibrio nigripulchritudo SFn135]CCO54604.1 putative Queuosine Biosynthesis QueE Radical SAM [Vibrio nigripulchritudo Wn13]CCO57926.1 putative Queuosine Biosynthesis QueE Radi
MLNSQYKINEMFETIQGEGTFTGVPSVFVRLQECPVGCAWCDTKQTWEAEEQDQVPIGDIMIKTADSPTWCFVSAGDIVEQYQKHGYTAKNIVITGGEPCVYDLVALTKAFEDIGCQCQIETSGTFEVKATDSTWVTVSPKIAMKGKLPVLVSALERANEIKHPVGTQKDIDQLDELIASADVSDETTIALQPISQKPRATKLCIDTCIARNWRLSVQTHKYLDIA